jgi:predicted metalloprotease
VIILVVTVSSVRFNPKATIDTSRTKDVTGGGRGGGLQGLPIPGGGKGAGGIVGIIVVLIALFLGGGNIGDLIGGGGGGAETETDRYDQCTSGKDASESADCTRALVENSLRDYWETNLKKQTGTAFKPATEIKTFTDAVSTGGCGDASAAVGPFYCPLDQTIYLDTTFFEDVLEGQLGGKGGAFVEPYVLGHEYGHHIQNLLGTMSQVKTQQGPKSDAVRLELQADCFAGMWAHGATTTKDDQGNVLITEITDQDISEAIDSAKAVGDDRIQQAGGGEVNPEGWTHGSAKQRVFWFQTGFKARSIKDCDTFAANAL